MTAIGRPVPGTTAELPVARQRLTARFYWSAFLFGIVLALAAVALAAAAFLVSLGRSHDGVVVTGVSVAGVPVGGLSGAEAEARVRAVLPPVRSGALTVALDDERVTIPYSAVGRDYNIDDVLAQAFAVGRTGDPMGALQE